MNSIDGKVLNAQPNIFTQKKMSAQNPRILSISSGFTCINNNPSVHVRAMRSMRSMGFMKWNGFIQIFNAIPECKWGFSAMSNEYGKKN